MDVLEIPEGQEKHSDALFELISKEYPSALKMKFTEESISKAAAILGPSIAAKAFDLHSVFMMGNCQVLVGPGNHVSVYPSLGDLDHIEDRLFFYDTVMTAFTWVKMIVEGIPMSTALERVSYTHAKNSHLNPLGSCGPRARIGFENETLANRVGPQVQDSVSGIGDVVKRNPSDVLVAALSEDLQ